MTEVYWFANGHEDRNDWLRFGLMRLHASGEVHFEERPLAEARDFGFDAVVSNHVHRHTSVIALRSGTRTVRVLVDSEDSFFWLCPLIGAVDVYFCAGYNRAFFADRRFDPPYPWQTEIEVAFYRNRAAHLIDTYGHEFHRVRPFAPIGPNLSVDSANPWFMQKARNLYFRASYLVKRRTPWLLRYLDLEARYRFLKELREAPVIHDVVLQDTLWGWPRHRVNLHGHLKTLSAKGYEIHSRLRWQEPMELDGGTSYPVAKEDFPLDTGPVQDYESMLAASRLAVFATGFHYGWRNIVTLAMMLGLPIYCDPFLIEHSQDHKAYTFFFNQSGDWGELEELMLRFRDESQLIEAKRRNQGYFDNNLAPEIVARSMLDEALATKYAPANASSGTGRPLAQAGF